MKQTILILIILVVLYFTFKKKVDGTVKQGLRMFTDSEAKDAILAVKNKYGITIARTVEKMMRLETAHFKSQQYIKTGTAGMEAGKWSGIPKNLPTIQMDDKLKKGMETFIVWNPKDFALFLGAYIVKYNGNFARWNTLMPLGQAEYARRVSAIKTQFV